MLDDIRKAVLNVLSKFLTCSSDSDNCISRSNCDSWNSLKHIEIIFALEEAFNIEFSEVELSQLNDSDYIIETISNRYAT